METLELACRDLRQMLEERARTDPERVYVYTNDDKLSFREFNRQVNQLANALKRQGVRKGDFVHIYMNNRPEMLVATMAIIKLGAVAGPVNAWWQGEEIRYVFNDSKAVGVITEGGFAPGVQSLRPQCPSLRFVIELSEKPAVGHLSYATLLKESPDTLDPIPLSGSDDSFLFYTSGTTGDPKGAVLSHVGVLHCLEGIRRCVDITGASENPIGLIFLPLFHVNAMMSMMSVIYRNLSAVLRPSFSATEFGEVVQRFKPSFFSAVPTIYRILVQIKDQLKAYDLSSLKYGLCGAAPMTPELFKEFEQAFNIQIIEGYGLTEGTIASTLNPRTGVRKVGSIGKAMPGQEVKVVDEEGREVSHGTAGEIIVRGPNVMSRYLNKPQATAETVRNGWLHTGDVGYCDADGYFFIVDRKKDMIIRGGEKIYPIEVERMLMTHPKVQEAAVVGVSSAHYGEEVKAFVVLKENTSITADELKAYCSEHLASYKVPSFIEFATALPKNVIGKTLRKKLKEPAKAR